MESHSLYTFVKISAFTIFLLIFPKFYPDGTYTSYVIDPPVELKGAYTLNTLLNDAEHLYSGLIKGPESIVVVDDELYTGVHGGDVVKLSGGNVEKVVKFGQPCDGQWQEKKCGRPFGLTAGKDGDLYIGDAYYGIWKYNVRDKTKECLVPQNISIDGRTPQIFNSIAIDESGDIYWTDTSVDVDIQNGFYAMFLDGSGRLLKYSKEEDKNIVLMDKLYFPNGIVISPDGEFVVIAEMITSRLIKYYINGQHKGKSSIFLNQLPGFPDKMKVHEDYIYVSLVHSRDKAEPVLFQNLSTYAIVRRTIVKVMRLVEYILSMINSMFPCTVLEKAMHAIGHFETVSVFAPKRVTILIVNWEGEVVASWHNLDGTLAAVSDVQMHHGYVYYGSPYNQYVGRTLIPKTDIKSSD